MILSKQRVKKVRVVHEERMQLKCELEILEEQVVGMHGTWMTELLAIRAQTGVRAMLAKKLVC